MSTTQRELLQAIADDAANWAAPQTEICNTHRFLFAQIAARIKAALNATPAARAEEGGECAF